MISLENCIMSSDSNSDAEQCKERKRAIPFTVEDFVLIENYKEYKDVIDEN